MFISSFPKFIEHIFNHHLELFVSLSEQRARKSWQSTVMITSTDMRKTQRQLPRGGRIPQRVELENGNPGAADFPGPLSKLPDGGAGGVSVHARACMRVCVCVCVCVRVCTGTPGVLQSMGSQSSI